MKRFGNLSVRRKKKSDVHCIQTHTLGAAEAAAEAVTSLLGRRVTNEVEHIVLALEMSRGVKMSPQIASGHQMSPFHSTSPSLPSAKSVFVSPPFWSSSPSLSLSFPSTHLFSAQCSFLSGLLYYPLTIQHCFPFHPLKGRERERVQRKRISFLNSAPVLRLSFISSLLLYSSYTAFFLSSVHLHMYVYPYIYFSQGLTGL